MSGRIEGTKTEAAETAAAPAYRPPEESVRGRLGAWLHGRAGLAALAALALAVVALASSGAGYERMDPQPRASQGGETRAARVEELAARLARRSPRGLYLVVDTWGNRVRLYRDRELLREMVSSTGSGAFLRDPVTGRTWTFETPRGERRVERKVRNPVWIKPDWAFIEEGFEPPKSATHRVDDVSLGDYALYLGDGYLIHGTLFQTLLGQRITHGCIRLGDDDLAYLYRTLPVGARVYLY